jgi:hypothetical protein
MGISRSRSYSSTVKVNRLTREISEVNGTVVLIERCYYLDLATLPIYDSRCNFNQTVELPEGTLGTAFLSRGALCV